MALPMEARRNGARPPLPPGPVVNPAPAPAAPVVMSEVPRWVRRTTTAGVLVVALVAAIGSYEHMRTLGVEVGEGWRASLLPFSVDGLALVAAMTMLVRRWSGLRVGLLAWAALVLSLGASLAANVAAAEPTPEARLWAAWPPVGLLLAMELLMQQIKARGGPGLETVRPGASNPFDGGDRR
jgi:hypothetical protein